jgi:hypothetical protein
MARTSGTNTGPEATAPEPYDDAPGAGTGLGVP